MRVLSISFGAQKCATECIGSTYFGTEYAEEVRAVPTGETIEGDRRNSHKRRFLWAGLSHGSESVGNSMHTYAFNADPAHKIHISTQAVVELVRLPQ